MCNRQLDISLSGPNFFTIPKHLPGRLTTNDYVFFHWPCDLDSSKYCVVVESNDASGDSVHRNIGPLQKSIELPHVRFAPYARIGVVPVVSSHPVFEEQLVRGSTYIIPDTKGKNGRFSMVRHGKF